MIRWGFAHLYLASLNLFDNFRLRLGDTMFWANDDIYAGTISIQNCSPVLPIKIIALIVLRF